MTEDEAKTKACFKAATFWDLMGAQKRLEDAAKERDVVVARIRAAQAPQVAA